MHPRHRLNLVLAIAVTALAVWLLMTPGPERPAGDTYRPISDLDPDRVRRITLSRPGKPDLVLDRSGTGWRINSPIDAPASPFRIGSLLSLPRAHSISTVAADPNRTGLADLDRPVTLDFDGQTFRFGQVNPLDRSRYVEHAGTVHLIEDTLYPQLLQDAAFFVDRDTQPAHAAGH